MATIGRIAVDLVSRTAQFQRDMKKARKTVGKFTASIDKVLTRVVKFGTVAGGIVTAAIAKITTDSFKAIAVTDQWSKRLSINTRMLSEYSLAAKIAGSESTDLFDALKDLTEKAGLARFGEQGEIEKFQKLGMSMKELNTLSNADLFSAVADKIAAIKDPAQQTAVAMELMGDNGFKMLNILKRGSAGLRATSEEAKRLGLSFDAIDAAKIEMANESVRKLFSLSTASGNYIAIELSPMIKTLADDLTEIGVAGQGSIGGLQGKFRTGSKVVAFFAEGVEMIKMGFIHSKIAMLQFMQQLSRFDPTTKMESFTVHIDEAREALHKLEVKGSPLERHANFWKEVERNAAKAAESVKKFSKSIVIPPVATELQSGLQGTVKGIAAQSKSMLSGVSGFASNLTNSISKNLIESQIADVQERMDRLNDMQSSGGPSDNRAAIGTGEIFSAIRQTMREDRESKKQAALMQKQLGLEESMEKLLQKLVEITKRNQNLVEVTI